MFKIGEKPKKTRLVCQICVCSGVPSPPGQHLAGSVVCVWCGVGGVWVCAMCVVCVCGARKRCVVCTRSVCGVVWCECGVPYPAVPTKKMRKKRPVMGE